MILLVWLPEGQFAHCVKEDCFCRDRRPRRSEGAKGLGKMKIERTKRSVEQGGYVLFVVGQKVPKSRLRGVPLSTPDVAC